MKLRKMLVLLLAMVLLVGAMVTPVSAKQVVADSIEYENDVMLSAYWAPHVSHKRKGKMTVSTDVPYSSSTKSMCVEYDVEKLGWGIWYYTYYEPDKVEVADYITFMAKAETAMPLAVALVQKDVGFGGGDSGAVAQLTTEWQRFTFPLSGWTDSNGKNLLESIAKEKWISNVTLGTNNTLENYVPVGKYWVDDIAFVTEDEIAKLPKVEGSKTPTTTKKPDTTTKKPDTTTKKPDTTTTGKDNGATTTEDGATDNSTTTLDGDVTTTTTADGVTADPTGALSVLDSLIKLDGDKLTVPEGMTVSNVLSRLKAEDGCEMAIVKDGAALEATEKIADGMSLVVSKDGAELKSYTLAIESAADVDEAPNNGWVLPVCIAAAVLLIAGVLLFVFRDKIFKKAN